MKKHRLLTLVVFAVSILLAAGANAQMMEAQPKQQGMGGMTMGQGMEAPMSLEIKRPRSLRMEFTFQGMTGVQAYDGKSRPIATLAQEWTGVPVAKGRRTVLVANSYIKTPTARLLGGN